MEKKKVRVIAFYLPQFHPIVENDKWWGNGFTEWTNVAKARPLFKGHYQPRIPADLGFYDLRLHEVREQQTTLAKYAGIEGFAYWHYWFAGKRLLERPFNEVLNTGKPDFPFCLAWANESWSGIWHGNPKKILIEQTYPGIEDFEQHFNSILNAFKDHRYMKIEERCIFYIYKPFDIQNIQELFLCWNKLALRNDLKPIYFIARVNTELEASNALKLGFDAVQTNWLGEAMIKSNNKKFNWIRLMRKISNNKVSLDKWNYSELIPYLQNESDTKPNYYPTILAGWDNSPRSGSNGRILTNFSPKTFSLHIENVLETVKSKNDTENVIFLRSWNEWAEGNYVEPDIKYGKMFLDVLHNYI